ncbi:GAF domain-like protein [Mycena crocata]|nr:GAF domain-like protein [Mycena crocata]
MPHADSALVPESITTKAEFWAHTYSQLDMLLDSHQRNWITNLSNASSLIYNSLLAFPPHFGNGQRTVNWCGAFASHFNLVQLRSTIFCGHIHIICSLSLSFPDHRQMLTALFVFFNHLGFYLDSELFPQPQTRRVENGTHASSSGKLLLGPFNGKPACQYINTAPGKARGVCADTFHHQRTIVVPDVESYPGHIACDGETRSEIVCPLILRTSEDTVRVLAVLDLDCLAPEAFDEQDKAGLEKIAELLVKACDW